MEGRLKLFLSMEGITASQFASKMNIQRSGMSHLLSGRNKPSYDFITRMLHEYPDLNAEWLLLGVGKPYKDGIVKQPVAPAVQEEPFIAPVDDEATESPNLFNTSNNISQHSIEEDIIPTEPHTVLPDIPQAEPPQERSIKQIVILYNDGSYEVR